jgi:Domain of unknown function (DUF4331)
MKSLRLKLTAAAAALALTGSPLFASSHQDAPLAILDPPANTTDVYAFVDQDDNGPKSLVVALGVYPFEEPGIGPNKFNFDDNVLYEIHVALGTDRDAGRATLSFQFEFRSETRNPNTILQNFTGVIQHVGDANQNFLQKYTVTKVDHRTQKRSVLGTEILVPPNNQGIATPFYNQDNDGEKPARPGVKTEAALDRYTQEAIAHLQNDYISFAGQRDDGFYADIQSIFDLLHLRNPGKDSQGGFNIHLMALQIPVSELGGDQQVIGVYATTSRKQVRILRERDDQNVGRWVQVARQGNPLFNEGFVAIADKDLYSRTSPESDNVLFRKYAENPELGKLINTILLGGAHPEITVGRTDLAAIFIPDLIKVDLSTPGVRLTNTGGDDPETNFARLSVFGGDVLFSSLQNKSVPGGWPNGRRFGDDVVDIAIDALLAPSGVPFPQGDGVFANDMAYNRVFPYESTPQNGRIHGHHGLSPE